MARINADLGKLTYAELANLRSDVDAIIERKKTEEREQLRAKLTGMAQEAGFDITDILGGDKRKGMKVAPKYRDPRNPQNTWTGRGRMPGWLQEAVKSKNGPKKEDFLITKSA